MKAIQIKEHGGPEVMAMVDLPVPTPKATEVLVKIKVAGVNFADLLIREGTYRPSLPTVLGNEGAGVVAEVGAEVTTVKRGDRVVAEVNPYRGVMGGYAEYAVVPADLLVRLPDNISEEQAAAVLSQGMTAHYLCHSTYPLKCGETALIHAAAGGVGLLLVQIAHKIGARVIGTVSNEEKAALAREAGADDVIVYTNVDFEIETKRLTNNKGVDVVYDSVGKETFERGLNVLRRRGHMVCYGSASGPAPALSPSVLAEKGSLFLTWASLQHYIATRQELEERAEFLFEHIAAGKLKLRIEHRYPLAQAAQAHRDIQSRKTTGKLLLFP